MTEAMAPPGASFLASRKGQLTLAFLCLVAFLDFMGFAIMSVALPTIQRDLHFSQQNLQWVISGYTVTYGGFLLLGGRLGDLLGGRGPRDYGVRGHLGPRRRGPERRDARRRPARPGDRRGPDDPGSAVHPHHELQ